jgi:hypothetical protein
MRATFATTAADSRRDDSREAGREMNWAGLLGSLAVSWGVVASIGWLVLAA